MMKRWMAGLLAAMMMIASCAGAWAQRISAEELAVELIGAVAERLSEDANAVSLSLDDGERKIAVTPGTLLRALFVSGDGESLLPDVTQADLALLEAIAGDVLAATEAVIEVERYAAQKDPAEEEAAADAPVADGTAAPQEQTTITIDVIALLGVIDEAIPSALVKHAAQVDDFIARNGALLCEAFGVEAFPKAEELAQIWAEVKFASLLPQDMPLTAMIMAGPGNAFGFALLGGGEELLLVSYGEGRLIAQVGGGEDALVFDSVDLAAVYALLNEAAGHISTEAFAWEYSEDAQYIRASFRLDGDRLARDLMAGLAAAVQHNEAGATALLERYTPWLEAFGAQGAREITWETLTQVLISEKDSLAMNLCWSIAYELGVGRGLAYSAQNLLPDLEMELMLPRRLGQGRTGLLSAKAGTVQLHAALSGQHLSATLQLNDTAMTRYELMGVLRDDSAQLTLGSYHRGGLQAELLLDAQVQDDVMTARLYDKARSELAVLVIDEENTARLTSGDLTVELIGLYPGLMITGAEGDSRFGLQITGDDRSFSASGYADGANAQLQMMTDDQGFSLTGAYVPGYSVNSYQAELKATDDSLSVDAGLYRSGAMMQGVAADASILPDGVHLNLTATDRSLLTRLAYRPGLLEIDSTQASRDWTLRAADMTRHAEDEVRVQVDWHDSVKTEERRKTSEETWLVTAKPADMACIFEIEGLQEQPVVLIVDLAPDTQRLEGYTLLSEADTANMIREWMEPEPEASPETASETTLETTPEMTPETETAAQPAAEE